MVKLRFAGWMLGLCLISACERTQPKNEAFETGPFGGPECSLMKQGDAPEIASRARAFFGRESGVEPRSIEILAITSCPGDFFVPIWATTEAYDTPREWIVQVPKGGGKLSLIRPE